MKARERYLKYEWEFIIQDAQHSYIVVRADGCTQESQVMLNHATEAIKGNLSLWHKVYEPKIADDEFWSMALPGIVEGMANPAQALIDKGVKPEDAAHAAQSLLEVMRYSTATATKRHPDSGLIVVTTHGIPERELPTLSALSSCAGQVARKILDRARPVPRRGRRRRLCPVPSGDLIRPMTWRTHPTTKGHHVAVLGGGQFLKTDPEDLILEAEDSMLRIARALTEEHPGISLWVPNHPKPLVALSEGVLVTPMVVHTAAALRAIEEEDLVARTLDKMKEPYRRPLIQMH